MKTKILKRIISVICAVGISASCATGFVSANPPKKEKDIASRLCRIKAEKGKIDKELKQSMKAKNQLIKQYLNLMCCSSNEEIKNMKAKGQMMEIYLRLMRRSSNTNIKKNKKLWELWKKAHPECTFAPEINQLSKQLNKGNFLDRVKNDIDLRKKKKEERIQKEMKKKCTFAPPFNREEERQRIREREAEAKKLIAMNIEKDKKAEEKKLKENVKWARSYKKCTFAPKINKRGGKQLKENFEKSVILENFKGNMILNENQEKEYRSKIFKNKKPFKK